MNKTRLFAGAAAAAAVGLLAACSPIGGSAAAGPGLASAAAVAADGADSGSAAQQGTSSAGALSGAGAGAGGYVMQAMAAGTVAFQSAGGVLEAQVSMIGLTPGSSHQVSAESPGGSAVQFPALTAGPGGQAAAALFPDTGGAALPQHSRIVIGLGDDSGDSLASEPIAESAVLPARPQPGSTYTLHAVTVTAGGTSYGRPAGVAQLSYDPAAQTLAVTLSASGLTPGPHAAHIHLGTCQAQGPVKYMLPDFTADARGNIDNQTQVVTGVVSVPGPGAWYLNLHQGGMTQILTADGTPTLYFRPMLCADFTTVAGGGSMAGASPAGQTAAQPVSGGSMTSPAAPMSSAPGSAPASGTTAAASPSAPPVSPSPVPSYAGPTHF